VADLIIGGSGFVGRNLARRLADEGREVVVLDRVPDSTGSFSGRFIEGDAQDASLLIDVLADVQPDVVYHMAANSDISAGVADASLDFGDTLMTTIAVRTAIDRVPVGQLVFASSSAIFGVSDQPLSETSEAPPAPVSWYGKAKLASEFALESLAAAHPDLPILVVRFPNVVGPLATHGVVFDFVRKLRRDPTRLDVLGDGNQTKPYVHVAELIDGIQFFAARRAAGITRINIGPPDLIDVKGIVTEVSGALELSPEVTYEDSPFGWVGDVPRYEFDTALMQREGFSIATTSRQAVRRAAEDLALEWTAG
jgi:UDP-glucose 4-epimerase